MKQRTENTWGGGNSRNSMQTKTWKVQISCLKIIYDVRPIIVPMDFIIT